jgi:hypothetical protein
MHYFVEYLQEICHVHWWLIPVILATQEAEIRGITTKSPQANSSGDPISKKNPSRVAPAIKVPTLQVQTPVLPEKRNQPCEC